jgi:hypothetical protein
MKVNIYWKSIAMAQVVLLGAMNSPGVLAADYCLTRKIPGTSSDSMKKVVARTNLGDWKSDQILIHGLHNAVSSCQDSKNDCHVGLWDSFKLTPVAATNSVQMTHHPSAIGRVETVVEMELDPQGLFLKGSVGSGTRKITYFVIYGGSNPKCEVGKLPVVRYGPVGSEQRCEMYKFEAYPSTEVDWFRYRPDQQLASAWTRYDSTTCIDPDSQPGGGGGHDPP